MVVGKNIPQMVVKNGDESHGRIRKQSPGRIREQSPTKQIQAM